MRPEQIIIKDKVFNIENCINSLDESLELYNAVK